MRRRKKNPSALTLVAIAAVIGVAVWGVSTIGKKKATTSAKSLPEKGSSTGSTSSPGKYVGTGWTNWPHKDFFLTERYFGETLSALGYSIGSKPINDPTWSVRDPSVIAAVKAFQADWNIVIKHAYDLLESYIGSGSIKLTPLKVDGKLGSMSVNALYEAFILNEERNWKELVSRMKAQSKSS